MRNLLDEKASDPIHGRSLYSTKFVSDADISSKRILDIGCGFGWFELYVLGRGASDVTGVDQEEESLAAGRRSLPDPRVEFLTASALELPFSSNSYDTVVSWEVLEHLPKGAELGMFKEAARVLKRGGHFYLSTPHRSLWSCIFDPAWWLIGHRHYSVAFISALALRAGFAIDKVVVKGGWWEVVGINNLYVAKWMFRRRPFFKEFLERAQDSEYSNSKGFTNIFIKLTKK